jgi:hypothetical protein
MTVSQSPHFEETNIDTVCRREVSGKHHIQEARLIKISRPSSSALGFFESFPQEILLCEALARVKDPTERTRSLVGCICSRCCRLKTWTRKLCRQLGDIRSLPEAGGRDAASRTEFARCIAYLV